MRDASSSHRGDREHGDERFLSPSLKVLSRRGNRERGKREPEALEATTR